MDHDALIALIDRLPEELREEVFNYASYLLERKAPGPRSRKRRANLHPGAAKMSDDFDAPLFEEFCKGRNP